MFGYLLSLDLTQVFNVASVFWSGSSVPLLKGVIWQRLCTGFIISIALSCHYSPLKSPLEGMFREADNLPLYGKEKKFHTVSWKNPISSLFLTRDTVDLKCNLFPLAIIYIKPRSNLRVLWRMMKTENKCHNLERNIVTI